MAIIQEKNKNKWTSDGRSWYYTYSFIDEYGNRQRSRSKLYKTKKEAKEEEAINILKKAPDNRNKNFHIVALDYFNELSQTRRKSTLYSYKKDYNNHIKPFFENYNIYKINTRVIKCWADEMKEKNISIAYCNKIYSILKNIFDYAMKYYELELNPAKMFGRFKTEARKRVVVKDKIRYITKEDFEQFINVIDNPLYRMYFIFLFYTGCRRGETAALTWKEVDFNKKEILICKTLSQDNIGSAVIQPPKNNKDRIIKMSKTLYDELLKYKRMIKRYSDFSDNWFVFGNGIYLPRTTINRYKTKYFKKLNEGKKENEIIQEITVHEFRHSHVSLLVNEYLKSGQTDTTKFFVMMSDRLGHTVEEMQKTYLHLFPTIQNEIVDILDNL